MYYKTSGEAVTLSQAINNWTVTGIAGKERYGTARNDVFYGFGSEKLYGYGGDDRYALYSADVRIVEAAGAGVDTIDFWFWGTLTLPDNVENAFLLSAGAIGAKGNALDNLIVAGKKGATLDGGGGRDVLVGGAAGDIFKVAAGNGSDAIYNFTPKWDAIQLTGYGFTSFGQIKAASQQVGADVYVTLSPSETLVLRDVSLRSLNSYDFGMAAADHVAPNATHLLAVNQCWNFHGWYAFTNAWGVGQMVAGRDYQLDGSFNSGDMTAGTSFNWSFALATSFSPPVIAYPEVIFGFSPLNEGWTPSIDPAAVFPLKIADMVSVAVDYSVSFGGNLAGFDVAYDIWFSNSATATGRAAVSNEVMVWLHKGDVPAWGTLVGQLSMNGAVFSIYHSGTYTALIADRDVPTGTIDITAVLNKLNALGIIANTEYLRSVELGAEVVSGSGWLTINDLEITTVSKTGLGGLVSKVVTGSGTTVHEIAALTATDVALADWSQPGQSALLDGHGVVVGSKSIAIGADGSAMVSLSSLAGYVTGNTVLRHDDVSMTIEHYTKAGVFTGVDRGSYTADGTLSMEHYDSRSVFTGVDRISVDDNVVTTGHFSADGAHVATEKTVTTGASVITEFYDGDFNFVGLDRSDLNGSTTIIQHYNATLDLELVDLVTVRGVMTTTKHYDAGWTLLGGEVVKQKPNGTEKVSTFDSDWNRVDVTLESTDGGTTLSGARHAAHVHGEAGAGLEHGLFAEPVAFSALDPSVFAPAGAGDGGGEYASTLFAHIGMHLDTTTAAIP